MNLRVPLNTLILSGRNIDINKYDMHQSMKLDIAIFLISGPITNG